MIINHWFKNWIKLKLNCYQKYLDEHPNSVKADEIRENMGVLSSLLN